MYIHRIAEIIFYQHSHQQNANLVKDMALTSCELKIKWEQKGTRIKWSAAAGQLLTDMKAMS